MQEQKNMYRLPDLLGETEREFQLSYERMKTLDNFHSGGNLEDGRLVRIKKHSEVIHDIMALAQYMNGNASNALHRGLLSSHYRFPLTLVAHHIQGLGPFQLLQVSIAQ